MEETSRLEDAQPEVEGGLPDVSANQGMPLCSRSKWNALLTGLHRFPTQYIGSHF